ncbi:hypothetical protein ABPG75_004583 [Micractinium tetrahymenae]
MHGLVVVSEAELRSPQHGGSPAPQFGLQLGSPVGLYPAPAALFFPPVHPWAMVAAGPPAVAVVGSPPLHGNLTPPIASMDALKARIMDVAPGQVKQAILSAQFVPRAAAFTSLIQMAAKAKQPQKAIEIFEAMSEVGVQPNTFSYSALISALARAGRWQEAEGYFEELRAQAQRAPDMQPNTVTFAALISAYEKGGQLGKALEAFEQQIEAGVAPDLITYSSLVTACERAGQTRKAVELMDQLHAAGMVGNHQLYHGLLSSCQAAGEWELALEVFLAMQCAAVRPTAHTVNLLLGTLVAAGQASHALLLAREALRSSYDLGAAAFNSLLQLLAGRGDWEAALGVFRAMGLAGQKSRPDAASAGLLVSACVQGGNPPLAAQLARELSAQGLLQQGGPTNGPAPLPGAPALAAPGSAAQQGAAGPALPTPVPLSVPMDGPGHGGHSGRQRSGPGRGYGPATAVVAAAAGGGYDAGASFHSASSEGSPKAGGSSRYGSSSLSNLSLQMDGV